MAGYGTDLDRYCDQDRFDEIERLHQQAFTWRPQGRIPLGIHVVNPAYTKDLTYDQWLNAELFLDAQVKILADTLEVGSDVLPVIALNHLGDAVLTSMFGAEQFMPEGSSTSLQDIGPTPLAIFPCIDEAAELKLPSLDAGIVPDVERMAMHYRRNLPEWVHVIGPMPTGPFSAAMELRGMDMLTELFDKADLCTKLVTLCAELQARLDRRFCKLLNAPLDRHISNFGISGTGLRLGDDSICNISEAMIIRFCTPAIRLVNAICGGTGHIHFCSLDHSRFEQIYRGLLKIPDVTVISSQFAFEYYQGHLNELRGRLAVEAFYGNAYAYVCNKYGSFKDWAYEFVPRYKNESGLVLYSQVSSVEEGKELWAAWQEAHRR